MIRLALLVCLAAPLARAQEAPPPAPPYVRASTWASSLDYRIERPASVASTEPRRSTEPSTAVGASLEVGVPVRPVTLFGVPGPETLGIEVSLARSQIDGDPSGALPTLSAWRSTAAVVSRSQILAGPVEASIGVGFGVGYSASVELVGTRASGSPAAVYEARRTHGVAPLFHLDVALGHTFGSTFVGVGSGQDLSLVPDLAPGGSVRLSLDVRQSF